nr:MAG TPA: putative tail component [Caudoviricetes sp.]DAG62736.1 MAG TPA: putative tail component [Caudoviricetes sp.]
MAKTVKAESLADAINAELKLYSKDLTERINVKGLESVKKLVAQTKATAPRGRRGKHYYSSISYDKAKRRATGSNIYTWYVKDPEYRLTHLLVHGHQTRNGGRTKANPFLQNALNEVLPEYEKNIEEAIKNE